MRKWRSRERACFQHVADARRELSLNPSRHRGPAWESLSRDQRCLCHRRAALRRRVDWSCVWTWREHEGFGYIKETRAVPASCCVDLGPAATNLGSSSSNFKQPDGGKILLKQRITSCFCIPSTYKTGKQAGASSDSPKPLIKFPKIRSQATGTRCYHNLWRTWALMDGPNLSCSLCCIRQLQYV